VPLAEALYAQGRYDEADATLKEVKDEWASGDVSVNAPRLALRAKLLAADGWSKLAEETADRALRTVRPTDWLCLTADALLAHAEVMQSAGRERDALASAEQALSLAETKGYEAVALRARAMPPRPQPAPVRRPEE
jgi:ATP/maltotriose-dependent transcriptional regulator MalT